MSTATRLPCQESTLSCPPNGSARSKLDLKVHASRGGSLVISSFRLGPEAASNLGFLDSVTQIEVLNCRYGVSKRAHLRPTPILSSLIRR